MNNFLPSGSVLPSGLLQNGNSSISAYDRAYKNYELKMGVIIADYEIDDPKNLSKMSVEYDVAVAEQNADLGQTIMTYHNCTVKDLFGGIADYKEFRYRVQEKTSLDSTDQKDIDTQEGSLVLLMCVSGADDSAVIIGGLNHAQRESKLTREAGHAYYSEFNGLETSIDKEGAFKILFKGATDVTGKPKNATVGGTSIEIDKDGSVIITDGDKETITVDKKNKAVEIVADKKIKIASNEEMEVSASKKISIATKDLLINAQGGITVSGARCDIKIEGATSVEVTSFAMKASSTINLTGQQVTIGELVFLGGQGGSPSLTMSSQFMGVDSHGAPVISTVFSGMSSKVFISN